VDIQPPGAQSAVWRAFRDGDLIAYGFTLMVFLDRLEALPEYPFRPVIDQEVCGAIQGFPARASRRASRGWMPWLRAVPR
jgi:hypothetical protein